MNFKVLESEQKLRGGYYTQGDIAAFLTRWVLEGKPKSVLEPSCGDGAFIQAVADLHPSGLREMTACEILPQEARKACERAIGARGFSVQVHVGDFLKWSLPRLRAAPQFDGALGNPPFIRYQYLDPELQARSQAVFEYFGLPFTKHTNAWVPFIIASLAQLRAGGRLAMVVPAEILHVLHAKPLRDFLLRQCSKVLILDPDGIWFTDTLQGVVLLLAQKRSPEQTTCARIAVVPMQGRSKLNGQASKHFACSDYLSGDVMNGKWMVALLTSRERELLGALGVHERIRVFKQVAEVDVGIVTGANNFFLVPDDVVQKYGLEQWARPMFGRSNHVAGVLYDKKSHEQNRKDGLPTNFLWLQEPVWAETPRGFRDYIKFGEGQQLHQRYKCRIRSPWYTVPSVYSTPIGMLKRSHHFPRLVLNRIRALTTDTAYRLKPHGISAGAMTISFVNSLTALTAELEGRHYGGGVLELVPSEIEKLLLPLTRYSRTHLQQLDSMIREGLPPEEVLLAQDNKLLRPLGISRCDCDTLLGAWNRLRLRRQRCPTEVDERKDE